MSLVNVAYAAVLTWANPTLTRLEDQALVPMYGEHPIELGLDRSGHVARRAVARSDAISGCFARARSGDATATPVTTRRHVVKALASFERAIVSARSPYDRYHFERDDARDLRRGQARRGAVPQPAAVVLHAATAASTSPARWAAAARAMTVEFHNTGPLQPAGPAVVSGRQHRALRDHAQPEDVGKFKAPTLRNIAVTAPYMHDGSVATLEDAIDHYAAGGRTIADGPASRRRPRQSEQEPPRFAASR